jgi:hypothetical protein
MESKREQALVGIFVLVVIALLIVTVFFLYGLSGGESIHYRVYFKNAAGIGPGTEVRTPAAPPSGAWRKFVPTRPIPLAWKLIFM